MLIENFRFSPSYAAFLINTFIIVLIGNRKKYVLNDVSCEGNLTSDFYKSKIRGCHGVSSNYKELNYLKTYVIFIRLTIIHALI